MTSDSELTRGLAALNQLAPLPTRALKRLDPTLVANFGAHLPARLDDAARVPPDVPEAFWAYLWKSRLARQHRIVLHGAGRHTDAVLRAVGVRSLENLVGITADRPPANWAHSIPVLPTTALRHLECDEVILSTTRFQAAMRAELADVGVAQEKVVDLFGDSGFQSFLAEEAAEANRRDVIFNLQEFCKAHLDSVVIVALNLPQNLLPFLRALRRRGIGVAVLAMERTISGLPWERQGIEGPFLVSTDLRALPSIIRSVRPSRFHVVNHMFQSALGALTILYADDTPVFSELVDITTLACPDRLAVSRFTNHPDLELAAEEIVWKGSAAIISQYASETLKVMERRRGLTAPYLHFCAYVDDGLPIKQPSLEGSVAPTAQLTSQSVTTTNEVAQIRHPRVAYAGAVHDRTAVNDATDLHQSLFDVATILPSQGFDFTIFNAFDAGSPTGWTNFRGLASGGTGFSYRPGLPIHELIEELTDYDLGWHVLDFRLGKADTAFYDLVVASKFFVYLAAGLPIVVSPEHRVESDLVRSYQMGLVLPFAELDQLSDRISWDLIEHWRQGVQRARADFSMSRQIDRLLDLYSSAA